MTPIVTAIPNGNCVMTQAFGSRPKFILAWKGHELDKKNNVVNVEGWADNDPRWADIKVLPPADIVLRATGLYPVGIPPRLVVSRMRTWKEWSHLDENGKILERRRLWVRRESTPLFPTKNFAYALRMMEVETSMGFKVDVDITVNVEGVNPETALTRYDDWNTTFDSLTEGRARSYIGGKDFFDLITEESGGEGLYKILHPLLVLQEKRPDLMPGATVPVTPPDEPFNAYLARTPILVDGVSKNMSDGLGIRITNATILDISISASEVELLKEVSSLVRQALVNANALSAADIKKRVTETVAAGDAAAMDKITESRAKRWQSVDQHYAASPHGAGLAIAEARTDAAVKIAELETSATKALAANTTLKTLVLAGSSARPVVPVGEDS